MCVSSGTQPQKKLPNELLEHTSHAFSLLWSVFRGRAQKDVFEAAMFERKKMKKTTSDVSEIKLFKLFIIGLKKKDSGEAALCWSHFIFFLRSNAITT